MKQYSYDVLHDDSSEVKTNRLPSDGDQSARNNDPVALHARQSQTPGTIVHQRPPQTTDEHASLRTSGMAAKAQPAQTIDPENAVDTAQLPTNDITEPTLSDDPPTHSTSVAASQRASSSGGMSRGATVGIIVAAVCVVCIVVAFVYRRKQARKMQSKIPSVFNGTKEMPIVKPKLAPPGSFGKLHSGRNRHVDKDRSSGSSIFGQDDPFTRRQMLKSGIWDDPVLVAARIPLEQIQIQELIARGGFGQVFMASFKGKTVAVKTLLPETAQDMNEINALFTETKVMAKLSHPCIVRFIGIAWESLSTVCCVTEYLVGGDLRALLNHFLANQTRPRGFDHDKVKIALDIVNGLTYLHSLEPNILHRDLKSRNVLLTSQLTAKLTDFGVSRERSDNRMTTAVGTSLWMAPEVMRGGYYDGKADIYSFGVLLSELDRHDMPYANVKNASGCRPTDAVLLQMVTAGNLQVEFSDDGPEEVLSLARECISVDHNKRPTAAEALNRLQNALKVFEVEEVAL